MISIPQYEILEKLYESASSLIYRAKRIEDHEVAILKVLREGFPSSEEVVRYRREYDVTRKLEAEGVPEVLGFLETDNRPVIVFKDIGGMDLGKLLHSRTFTFSEKLRMAAAIAGVLDQIHSSGIIHRDIKPSNVIYSSATGQLQVIDFGSSQIMTPGSIETEVSRKLHGTQPYMSPEHTGRVNRPVDRRSDLYSLGVTYYEIFTTRLPFETEDLLEIVHAHIARIPKPPNEVDPDIPRVLSDLIMKLLSKNPEERYQSARGVKADLEKCRRQFKTSGKIPAFPLARQDVSGDFDIPKKIYGRDREKAKLLSAYKRVTRGGKNLVLVHGPPGIGKTALVLDIDRTVAREAGTFIYGRFEQAESNAPFSALVGAFKELVQRILSEGPDNLRRWRERLKMALGQSGQVLIDSIPEAELVIGPQPLLDKLEPAAAHARQCRAFLSFLRVFCRPEQPLVLFLDQIHWADRSSLEFLASLMESREIEFLLLITAYRENTAALDEWLKVKVTGLEEKETGVENLGLEPLNKEQVTRLVADTVHSETDRIAPLAELLASKTGGNPFFVKEFLRILAAENLIFFDPGKGRWSWDLKGIESKSYTDNVLDLMTANVDGLGPRARDILQTASALGTRFGLSTLASLQGKTTDDISEILNGAVEKGLIVPYRSGDTIGELPEGFTFVHDRIQQALYQRIPESDRPGLHLSVGQTLRQTVPEKDRPKRLLEIVSHLNRGAEAISRESERLDLASLNLEASRHAKGSGMFQAAFTCAQSGLELLEDSLWDREYGFMMALYLEIMETASLVGSYEEMETLGKTAISRAKTDLDRIRIYQVRVNACLLRNHWPEAARQGIEALTLLGISFPDALDVPVRQLVCERIKAHMAGRSIEELVELPKMTDPNHLAAMQIMTKGYPAFGAVFPDRAPLLVAEMIGLSMDHGNASASAHAYIYFAIILCAEKKIDEAYRFGRLAIDLTRRLNARNDEVSVKFIFDFAVRHWKEHLRVTLAPLLEAHKASLENGELFQATYSLVYRAVFIYMMGRPLEEADKEMEACGQTIQRLGQTDAFNFMWMFRQTVANLDGRSEDPLALNGPFFDEEKILAQESEADNRGRDFGLFLNKMVLCLLFEKYEDALKYAEVIEASIEEMPPVMALWTQFVYYEALTRITLFDQADAEQQKIHKGRIDQCMTNLEAWHRDAPMNMAQKHLLVEAELARVENRPMEAMDLYDQAISAARKNRYLQDEALANELAAKFYLNRGKKTIGRSYLLEAHYTYGRWGAQAKVSQLEEKHGELLSAMMQSVDKGSSQDTRTISPTTSKEADSLDLASAFKAAQALSREIVLEKLLSRLMSIIMENAGAEKGFLILDHEGRLTVESGAHADGTSFDPTASASPEDNPDLSAAIVNYVARTREVIVLEDAAREGKFTTDPYIRRNRIRSVLCLPLVNKDALTGLIYLENNLFPGAFTPDRFEALNWLSTQAAISLENARLYQKVSDYSSWLEGIIEALNVAQEVQQSLLPWRAPQLEGLEIAGRSLYCDETGGDYFDYIDLGDPQRIAVVLGDVSGHGISAALLMSGTRAYLRSRATLPGTPAEIITAVNRLVSADAADTGQFMTLLYLVIDLNRNHMTWVRAGQDPALIYDPDAETFAELGGPGLALGIDDEWEYAEQTVGVTPGQIVVLATDGVWEAHNVHGEMFGKGRFKEVIRRKSGLAAEGIRQAVVDAVTEFRGEAAQDDDITLVIIKFDSNRQS